MNIKHSITVGWKWIPTLYFAEGLPYCIIMSLSVTMYKNLNISNSDIALFTSLLYFPWTIKPLWSPFIDILWTKRSWVLLTQFLVGAGFLAIALVLPSSDFLLYSLLLFSVLAFCSATHDIAADGFYMLGLSQHDQVFFVGIRTTFYRIAFIAQGLLVVVAGYIQESYASKDIPLNKAWSLVFYIPAILFMLIAVYHIFTFPKPTDRDNRSVSTDRIFKEFALSFIEFFKKKNIIPAILFLLIYRLAESQLVKMIAPFLLDPVDKGGLGLTTKVYGLIYSTLGLVALSIGGIAGGILASRNGLKYWIWWMAIAMNLPNIVYVLLAIFQPSSILLISLGVVIEQFGYGFGFTAYTLYMIYLSDGKFKTSHYALCTGFMALGMMIPGMPSGWIQELVGYKFFFIWVVICTIPGFLLIPFLKISNNFGKRNENITSN